MATPTAERMLDLATRHALAEHSGDWAAVLATMSSDPYYEWYPLGIRVRGAEALTMMWERLLTRDDPTLSAILEQSNREWVLKDHVLFTVEWSIAAEGRQEKSRTYAIFGFTDDRIEREICYCDPVMEKFAERAFDKELLAAPGVERIPGFSRPLIPTTATAGSLTDRPGGGDS